MAHRIARQSNAWPWNLVLTGLLLLGALALPSHLRADDEEAPIVLTNDDILRVQSRARASDDAGKQLVLTGQASEPVETAQGRRGPAPIAPMTTAAEQEPQAGTWQEEYFRLKAVALRQALERGETIDFRDGIQDTVTAAAPSGDPPASVAAPTSGPACMYGGDGKLLHQPAGIRCSKTRRRAPHRPSSQGYDSCVYDRDGSVIYTPLGNRCNRH